LSKLNNQNIQKGRRRKRQEQRYNKHGIPIQGERPPRRRLFPGERHNEDE